MEGSYWIGTNGGGLCQFWDKRFEFYGEQEGFINDAIWVIKEDHKGNFWFGSEKGLTKYTPIDDMPGDLIITNFTRKHGLQGDEVDAIYEDDKGILWLGVLGLGVQKFNPSTDEFSLFTAIQDDQILSIIADKNGNLWFGSNGGGLYRYNLETSRVDNFNTSNGLPSNDVFALLLA
jgi:ligand-binding sensor domain-containing protein